MSGSADTGIAFALRDGSRVVVRPVRPDDRELLLVSYLTDVDHTTTTRPPLWTRRRGRGRRRALRPLLRTADTAEAAVTVIDDWQGRGVGTALVDLLAENREMLDVLEGVAPIRVVDRQRGTIEIEAELPPAGAGPHLHGLLGQAARASAKSSSRNASASACGSGTSPASVRKPTVTLPA